MEQFSEFEGRIKDALDRISVSIEKSENVQEDSTGIDHDARSTISELIAANKQLEDQLQKARDSQELNEILELREQFSQLKRDRQEETKEMQRLYDQLALALNNGDASGGGGA